MACRGPPRAPYSSADLDTIAGTDLGIGDLLTTLGVGDVETVDETIGHAASWAVWPDPATLAQHASRASWITSNGADDLLGLRDDVVREALHPDVVFLALNKGKPDSIGGREVWGCFHVSTQDAKLATAIWPVDEPEPLAPLWGGYMTDVFKGLPTVSGAGITALLSTRAVPAGPRPYLRGRRAAFQVRGGVIHPLPTDEQLRKSGEAAPLPDDLREPLSGELRARVLDTMADVLARELDAIGADASSVGFVTVGGDAEASARDLFGRAPLAGWRSAFEGRRVKITHYSHAISPRAYRKELVVAAQRLSAS